MAQFADVEIRIGPKQHYEREGQSYEAYHVLLMLNILQRVEGWLDGDYPKPELMQHEPEVYGRQLFEWLFPSGKLREAWAEIRGQHRQRRVRLDISPDAPELHRLPWELLRNVWENDVPVLMAADSATPFSRFLPTLLPPGRVILERPIRMLVAMANPKGLNEWDLAAIEEETEWGLLQEAVMGLQGELEIERLEGPVTLKRLSESLLKGYHILHFIGHGWYSEKSQQTLLFLANEANEIKRETDEDVVAMLRHQEQGVNQLRHLRLIYLASCSTAQRSSADAFAGLGPKLIQAGVPAVVAMQDLVKVPTSREFTRTFYSRLLDHGQVDLAINEARAASKLEKLLGTHVPVVFMRLYDGNLFGNRGKPLGERADSFWNTLLSNIKDGECTPFLGAGVTEKLLPSPAAIARKLAEDNYYPLPQRDNLFSVSQFIGTTDNKLLRKQALRALSEGFLSQMKLKDKLTPQPTQLSEVIRQVQAQRTIFDEGEIHYQLAELNLPLYITTNVDDFMYLALKAKQEAGQDASPEQGPRQYVPRWRKLLRTKEGNKDELDPPPSSEEPVVLHLFGKDDDMLSMVLTQDDYLDYFACLARYHQHLIPSSIDERLASTTLLFLGYRLDDLDLKIILRGLLANVDSEGYDMLHVAVQMEVASENQKEQEEVIRYFQKYFSKSNIDVYWGSTHQFVADLYSKWQEYQQVT